jgi:hypothetical protein
MQAVGEPSRFARFEVRKAGRFAYFALKTGSGLCFQDPPAAQSVLPRRHRSGKHDLTELPVRAPRGTPSRIECFRGPKSHK